MSELTKASVDVDNPKTDTEHKHGRVRHSHPLDTSAPHAHGDDFPSHEETVRRSMEADHTDDPADDAEVPEAEPVEEHHGPALTLTEEPPTLNTREVVVERLASALRDEFATLFGGARVEGAREAWVKAAGGVLDKLQVEIVTGTDPNDLSLHLL